MNHALAIVAKVGTREISVSLWIILAAVTEIIIEMKFYKTFPLYISSLNPFIINSPNKHKFNYRFNRRFEKCNYLKKWRSPIIPQSKYNIEIHKIS